jgi:hypothetical protein
MSPEIFQNKPYSYKSDVWALGCVLYEMTTLNHAFDANSLNGLATKIVKGKYPPIHAKYSRYLRELIGQMLMINPQQRPDMDQILRKPFIKKHVLNFFIDIASRPSTSIGEGTMVFKAAAGGHLAGNAYNDSTIISLRQQLTSLDMADALSDAMKPKSNPQDDQEALKLARDQAGALKREQEHKKMVEAALEKLRLEREIRSKQRNDPYNRGGGAGGKQAAPVNPPPSSRRDDPPSKRVPPPQVISPPPQQIVHHSRNPSNEALRKEVKDNSKDRERAQAELGAPGGRRRTFGEEKDREKERSEREKRAVEEREKEKKVADDRKREDRRREEVRAEAKAREEARQREEAKQREEQQERLRMEQVRERAEAAARAKREGQREKERDRQREEIEQLKRDKLELDRRTNERERQREDRLAEERQRVEDKRREQLGMMQLKIDNMNDVVGNIKLEGGRGAGYHRSQEEKGEEYMSARERVYLRRQEKQAKEEAERLEALREAETENRRIRSNAQNEFRNKVYGDNVAALQGGKQPVLPNRRGSNAAVDPYSNDDETPRYEFEGQNRPNRIKANRNMDAEELSDRLDEVNRGKPTRYPERYPDSDADKRHSNKSSSSNTQVLGDDGSDDTGSEGELFQKGESNVEEEEEDLHRREEELRAELNFATLRCEELKRTLQETKTYLGPRLPTRGKDTKTPARSNHHDNPREVVREDEEEEEDFDLGESDEYEVREL